ncbi:hypothetical protein [Stenotrophomonas rhizophila]|uniref:hypothetical protein n=1 Tax=Stenotrophomonas rhizophila TaxID=216778 RepID=UPI0028A6A09F|nr:hypothetical protein [Stenotrophomonas rhizophila]
MNRENRLTDVVGILAAISSTIILLGVWIYVLATKKQPASPFFAYLLMAHSVGFFSTLFLNQVANIIKAPRRELARLLDLSSKDRAKIALNSWFYMIVSGSGLAGIYLLANAPAHWAVFAVILLGSFLAGEFTAPSRRRYLRDCGLIKDEC